MSKCEDFSVIYHDLRCFYGNSGDLASAMLPFICQTSDFQLAAAMLHSHLQLFESLSLGVSCHAS
jgi:hypothetical protein